MADLFLYQFCYISNPAGFSHNFSKKISSGPKNGLEIRPSRFSTICTKDQLLKLNIIKVTVHLRRKLPLLVTPPCILTY